MFKRYITFQKNSGISPYIWTVLCILPFYFIFQTASPIKIVVGIILTILFFIFLSNCIYFERVASIPLDLHPNWYFYYINKPFQLCLFCLFPSLFYRQYQGEGNVFNLIFYSFDQYFCLD